MRMLRKKNYTVLLALLIVAAMSGSAFAADAVNGPTTLLEVPTVLTPPVINGEALQVPENSGLTAPQEVLPEQTAPTPEEVAPAVEPQTPTVEPQTPTVEPQTPAVEPQTPPVVEPQTPAVEEPPVVEAQPEGTATSETPIAEPETTVPTEEPLVTEPAITAEEVATEPAIVVPEAATLTITHRLIVDGESSEEVQVIEGLVVGQTLDLTEYLAPVDWAECITQEKIISLDQAENAIVLEYAVKADADVDVAIESGTISVSGDNSTTIETDENEAADDSAQ